MRRSDHPMTAIMRGKGNYSVLLNLSDPMPSLSSRPEYSIRLANNNAWQASTGFNKLNHVAQVQP